MTPWDLIVWALCAAPAIAIIGAATALAVALINIARGKL